MPWKHTWNARNKIFSLFSFHGNLFRKSKNIKHWHLNPIFKTFPTHVVGGRGGLQTGRKINEGKKVSFNMTALLLSPVPLG